MKSDYRNKFFLISFLPALAYWYLEENYPIKIAVAGGVILAILEIILEKFITKHVHTLSKFNFYLIVFLGGLSLTSDDGLWFKLQPAITGIVIGGFLFFKVWKGKGLLAEMMESMGNKNQMPRSIITDMEKHISAMFFLYGCFMIYTALNMSTPRWVFFKTIGFYIYFGIFMVGEFILIRFKARKMMENQRKAANLKRF